MNCDFPQKKKCIDFVFCFLFFFCIFYFFKALTLPYDKVANPMLSRLQRRGPYYKRNLSHICSFFVKGKQTHHKLFIFIFIFFVFSFFNFLFYLCTLFRCVCVILLRWAFAPFFCCFLRTLFQNKVKKKKETAHKTSEWKKKSLFSHFSTVFLCH